MTEDRSLDEFAADSEAGGGRDGPDEAVEEAGEATEETDEPVEAEVPTDGGDEGADETDEAADETDEAADETDEAADETDEAADAHTEAIDVDPAVPTATWATDGAACDRCGERAARRWFDEGDLVCGDCKEW